MGVERVDAPRSERVGDRTGSLFGHRVSASRRLRSSSAASGTWTSKGVTAFVAGGSTSSATLSVHARAVSGRNSADKIAAPLVDAAAYRNSRRDLRGGDISFFSFVQGDGVDP